jgi:hypothetical protein
MSRSCTYFRPLRLHNCVVGLFYHFTHYLTPPVSSRLQYSHTICSKSTNFQDSFSLFPSLLNSTISLHDTTFSTHTPSRKRFLKLNSHVWCSCQWLARTESLLHSVLPSDYSIHLNFLGLSTIFQ